MRVAERITALIRKDRYLTSEQKEQLAKRQQEAELSKYDLGYGAMGNGLTVWNRKEQEHGDYKTIAHIDADRSVTFYDDNLPDAIRERIQEVARTTELTVSATQDTPVFEEPSKESPVSEIRHIPDFWICLLPTSARSLKKRRKRKSRLYWISSQSLCRRLR